MSVGNLWVPPPPSGGQAGERGDEADSKGEIDAERVKRETDRRGEAGE